MSSDCALLLQHLHVHNAGMSTNENERGRGNFLFLSGCSAAIISISSACICRGVAVVWETRFAKCAVVFGDCRHE